MKQKKKPSKQQRDDGFLSAYKFCPKCGERMEPKECGGSVMPVCTNKACGYIFWQTSSPCVVAIIQNDKGQVLVTERAIEPEKGKLDLPGGFMKWGEAPAEAAKRETKEEVGVEIEIIKLVDILIDDYWYQNLWEKTLTVGFTARITKGEPSIADPHEIASVGWFDVGSLEWDKIAFTSNKKFIELIAAG